MKFLIFVALVIFDYSSSIPFVTDTPEVVAQKQLFQKLYDAAALAAAAAPDVDVFPINLHQQHHQNEHQQQNHQQYQQQQPLQYFPHEQQHSSQQSLDQGHQHQEHQGHQQHQEHQGDQQHQEQQGHQAHQGHGQHQEHQQQHEEHQNKQDTPSHQNNNGEQEQGHSNSPSENEFHTIKDRSSLTDKNDQLPNQWKEAHASDIPAGLSGSSHVENTPEVNDAIAKFAKAYNAAVLASMAAISSSSQKSSSNYGNSHLKERSAPTTEAQSESSVSTNTEASNLKNKPLDSPEITALKLHFSKIFQKQLMRLLGWS